METSSSGDYKRRNLLSTNTSDRVITPCMGRVRFCNNIMCVSKSKGMVSNKGHSMTIRNHISDLCRLSWTKLY